MNDTTPTINKANSEKLLTLVQVAERLQVGRTTVWKIISEGGLRRVKFGKVVRVKESVLVEWIEKHMVAQ